MPYNMPTNFNTEIVTDHASWRPSLLGLAGQASFIAISAYKGTHVVLLMVPCITNYQ